jgi:lipopolysaccharide/colanic/teichoic acid biosynthesis glycosyltransferase
VIAKRTLDLAGAAVGLLVFSPVLLAVAVAIKFESRGPVFYRGTRTGLDGHSFRIFKFRTMNADAERTGGPSTALNDPRLTRVGPFLRKYKFDELPQLINVLRGDMSLVGPRPQVARYTSLYTDEEKAILSVKPGLTDYASIEFFDLDRVLGNENVDEKYMRDIEPRKNRLRLKYVREQSMVTDLRLIVRTIAGLCGVGRRWSIED